MWTNVPSIAPAHMASWARSRKPAITLSNSVPDGNLIAVGTSDAFKTAISPCTMEWAVEAPVQYCSPSWSKVMPWASQCRHMAKHLAGEGVQELGIVLWRVQGPVPWADTRTGTSCSPHGMFSNTACPRSRTHCLVQETQLRFDAIAVPLLPRNPLLTSCSVDRPPASVLSDGRSCFFRSKK